MKIDRIRSYEVSLGLKLGSYKSAVSTIDKLTTTLIAVDTDDGLTGWGEVCPYGASYLPALHGGVQPVLAELATALIGQDPREIGIIDAAMDRAVRDQFFVKTALDYACWDILGKSVDLPVVTLLGGMRTERLPLIASVPGGIPDMRAALAHYRAQEYRQFSFHIAAPDPAVMRAYVDVIGSLDPEESCVVDANRSWSLMGALEIARGLAGQPVALEQPCADIAQCTALRARVEMPIVLDETITTPGDLITAWQARAVDAIALKIGRCSSARS